MDILNLLFKINTSQLQVAQQQVQQLGQNAQAAQTKATGLSGALNAVGSVGGLIGDVADHVQKLASNVAAVTAAATALPAILIAAAGAAGILAAVRFAGPLDDIGDMAEKFGLAATQMSILKQQMESAGTSVDAYYLGLQKLANALTKSGDEGSAASDALKTLGVNVKDGADPMKVASDLAEKYGDKLRNGAVTTKEMADLQSVLGKTYRETIVAIEQNAIAQQRSNDFFQAGIGISKDGSQAASDLEAAQNDLNIVLQAVGSQLVGEVVPAFTGLIEQLVESYKNGGLVKVAFDGIRLAAQLVMVPIRGLIQVFIGLDTFATAAGKTIGAVFAAMKTGSFAPLRELQGDLDALMLKAAATQQKVGLWGSDSGEIDAPKAQRAETERAQKKPKTQREPGDSNIVAEIARHADALIRLRNTLGEVNGVQAQTNLQLVEADIAMGKYDAKVDAHKNVIRKAATEQELLDLKSKAAEEDKLQASIKAAKAFTSQWDAMERLNASEQERIKNLRQSINDTEIARAVLSAYGKTQDDVKIAIAESNIVQEERRLSIALATGAEELEIQTIRNKIAALKEERGLLMDQKDNNQAAEDESRTWQAGWKKSYDQYTKDATNAAKTVEQAFSSVTGHMGDALSTFVTTGKLNFKSLAASILADLAKIAMQKAIAGIAASMFAKGGAFSGGTQFFADGGVVDSPTAFGMSGGKTGVMGEAGPEAIMPLKRTASGALGVVAQGGGTSVTNHYSMSVSIGSVDSNERQNELLKQIDALIESKTKKTVADQMRQGNMLSRAR